VQLIWNLIVWSSLIITYVVCTGSAAAGVPWATLWGLMEHAIYGGRIDSDSDLRVLRTYVTRCFQVDSLVLPGSKKPKRPYVTSIMLRSSLFVQSICSVVANIS